MSRTPIALLAAVLFIGSPAAICHAQRVAQWSAALAAPPPGALSGDARGIALASRGDRFAVRPDGARKDTVIDAPWWAPLASAIVPGAGQLVLEQDRAVAYVALEGYMWLRYAADASEARRQRREYRRLAVQVARAMFPGPKPLGDFEYYERMESYLESGVFDLDPDSDGVQPDRDTTTYNGALWLQARRLFWEHPDAVLDPASPAYRAAQEFYEARAVRPEYSWSWQNAHLEHDLFRRTIARSNEAFRRSIADLGVILANHVLSTIDAYVAVRLRRDARLEVGGYEISAEIPWAPFGGR